MIIKRDFYLNKLISKKHNGLIKVITGVRRCGKSFLLFNLFKTYLLEEGIDRKHIIEIAVDSFENKRYQDPYVLMPYLKEQFTDNEMYYVLLDEVQLLEEFESVLNSLIRMENVDVYVTGSNARFLSKDVITEFRGRGDEVHMYPLSFSEFMSVYPSSKQDGWNEYMLYGGLPLVLRFQTPVKYYFTDMGLRNARLNFRQLEETHTMENIIFNELKIRGFNVDVGVIVQNTTDSTGNRIRKQLEIDFVCNKGSKRFYIQSAYLRIYSLKRQCKDLSAFCP